MGLCKEKRKSNKINSNCYCSLLNDHVLRVDHGYLTQSFVYKWLSMSDKKKQSAINPEMNETEAEKKEHKVGKLFEETS